MIAISETELLQLQALAGGTGSLARRARIILEGSVASPSAARVAEALATSPATVRYWWRRFTESRLAGLYDRNRSGAPRRISPKTAEAIHVLEANGLSTRQIAKQMGVSQSSVSRLNRPTKRRSAPVAAIDSDRVQDLDLIVRLFESLSDEAPWERFLDALRHETRSDYCTLLVFSGGSRKPVVMLSADGPLEGDVAYSERFYNEEPMAGIPEGKATTLSEVLTADQLHGTQFYKQYLSLYGVGYVLGIDIGSVRGIAGRLRLARIERRADYCARERLVCERLTPFLRTALDLFVKRIDTATENEALSATISGMSVGSILVDEDAHMMDANNAARAILEQRDGLLVVASKLCLHTQTKSKELEGLIRNNAKASLDRSAPAVMRSLLIDRPSGRESISLLVRPATIASTSQLHLRPMALINLVDPAQPRLKEADALAQLFGLTRAQSRVALSISNGLSVAEIAQAQCTSPNTIRSHLLSIYSKMGISRQADLVRAVLISVALLTEGVNR